MSSAPAAVLAAVAPKKRTLGSPLPTLTLLGVDCGVILAAFAGSILLWRSLGHPLNALAYARLWPCIFLFIWSYTMTGLYRFLAFPPVEEIRRIVVSTTAVFLILIGATFLLKDSAAYSRATALLAWCAITTALPVVRSMVRRNLGSATWFARPVVVFGAGNSGARIVEFLNKRPSLGLRPVAVFDDRGNGGGIHDVRIEGNFSAARQYVREHHIRCGIFAAADVSRNVIEHIERYGAPLQRIIIVPELAGLSTLWVTTTDLGGTLALELRDNLLHDPARYAKRSVDVLILLFLAVFIIPVVAVIALLVRFTSPGPAFFTHTRIGRDGRLFQIWKFRTMVSDADRVLREYFDRNPEQHLEWLATQKIKRDPRLTVIGSFLRRTSLDELPQLWNVLRGEMSLVGPRPIVQSEIARYGKTYDLYVRVRPGLTGLWQVSGRNDVTYPERIALDEYYVRNWSPWLDIYILARTITTVLTCRGAY